MEPQSLSLREIHLPEAINWWPPAIGWWLVLLACFFIAWLVHYITRPTAIKAAKKQLLEIKQDNSSEDIHKLAKISELLRRVAISNSPRSDCASLTGQAWLEYLDKTLIDKPFTQGAGQYLANAHFKKIPDNNIDITKIINICEKWLKAQRNKK
jgi:hypothetical protein